MWSILYLGVYLGSPVGADVLLRGWWRQTILSFFPSPSVGVCGSAVPGMAASQDALDGGVRCPLRRSLDLLGRGHHIHGRC